MDACYTKKLKLLGKLFFQNTFGLFLLTGFLTAVVYFSVFSFMWDLMKINYKYAVTCGYWGALCFHFLMNRFITFRSYYHIGYQVIKYVTMALINYLITLLVTIAVVKKMLLSPYIGVIVSVCITVLSGYLLSKHWVFRHGK